jgi:hypothetical protein
MTSVIITAGSAVTNPGPGLWHVAKKQLVSIMQVILGNSRLRVAPNQEHADTLKRELGTFKAKITDAGNETFESWREPDHDDLVLAVALACWEAETIAWPPKAAPRPTVVRVLGAGKHWHGSQNFNHQWHRRP